VSRLTLHTRSFHPMSNFGLGGFFYEGDNRDFSTSLRVTSRIKNEVYIDLAAARIELGPTRSNSSRNAVFGWEQKYDPKDQRIQPTATLGTQIDPYREDGDQHAQVFLSYRGQNFAMPGMKNPDNRIVVPIAGPGGPPARIPLPGNPTPRNVFETIVPDLDVTMSLDIMVDRADKTMSFAARMVGDGFPNAESFLLDASSQPLCCVAHRRIGSASGQLHGNRKIAMASGSALVDFPEDKFGSTLNAYWAIDYATHSGGQIDLISQYGSKPGTRSNWNDMHLKHDAKGDRLRRWYSDNELHLRIDGTSGSSMP
jgi:hypothetical protein